MKKIEWQIYKRGGLTFHPLWAIIKGSQSYYRDFFPRNYRPVRFWCSFEGKELEWGWGKDFLFKIGDWAIEKLKENNGSKFIWGRFNKSVKLVSKVVNKIYPSDIKKLNDEVLLKIFREWYSVSQKFHCYSGLLIDALDESLFLAMEKETAKYFQGPLLNEYFSLLTTPLEMSYVNKCRLELLKLNLKLRNKFIQPDLLIERYVNKFWWTPLGWGTINILTKKKALSQLKILSKKNKKEIELEIKNLIKTNRILSFKKKKFLKENNLENKFKLRGLLEIFEASAIYHDLRKENQMKIVYCGYLLIREISKRRKISLDLLQWATDEDILKLLIKDKIDLKELHSRAKRILVVFLPQGGILVKSGKEAFKLKSELFPSIKIEKIKEFRGLPAFPGKIKGKTRVSHSSAILNKNIKTGEILVTGQTLPDFVPAIKKSAAIITDEGGITCHAAIISRELKKPCIVGTKIATKVLRDGQIVEVDANKGIVKIIK